MDGEAGDAASARSLPFTPLKAADNPIAERGRRRPRGPFQFAALGDIRQCGRRGFIAYSAFAAEDQLLWGASLLRLVDLSCVFIAVFYSYSGLQYIEPMQSKKSVWSRRRLLQGAAMGPLLGELSSAQLAKAAKAGGSVYELGVRTLINGQGVVTFALALHAARSARAMERAQSTTWRLWELQRAVGARLAKFVGAEAAIVCSGRRLASPRRRPAASPEPIRIRSAACRIPTA